MWLHAVGPKRRLFVPTSMAGFCPPWSYLRCREDGAWQTKSCAVVWLTDLIIITCLHTNTITSLIHSSLVGDLSIVYRYFQGHFSQQIRDIIPVPLRRVRTTRSSTHLHPFQVSLPNPRTLSHKSWFIPSTCNLRNVLCSSCFPLLLCEICLIFGKNHSIVDMNDDEKWAFLATIVSL